MLTLSEIQINLGIKSKMASNYAHDNEDLGSTFSEDPGTLAVKRAENKLRHENLAGRAGRAKVSSEDFREKRSLASWIDDRQNVLSMNAYDRHKLLINEYFLYCTGSTEQFKRDKSRDKTDYDVVKSNHRFLWTEAEMSDLTWEQKLAKKYYEKLFKEYCVCDLSRYKENKVGMRWRTENELKVGKGQFICGGRKCEEREFLRTWEVNFSYVEETEKKNALVKARLCPECSIKLNYHHKKKEVNKKSKKRKKEKKMKKNKRKRSKSDSSDGEDIDGDSKKSKIEERQQEKKASEVWSGPVTAEQEKSREDDFSEYLDDLFL